jgi:hypothetical protein
MKREWAFALVTGLSVATFSAIGLSRVLAGVANTLIAASTMAVEFIGASPRRMQLLPASSAIFRQVTGAYIRH